MITNFSTLKKYIKADLYRYCGNVSLRTFVRCWFTPGFRFSFWLRVCQFESRNYKGLLFLISFFMLRRYQFKYGICIHYSTEIGYGLYIGHYGGIVINPYAKIGNNVNLNPGVLLGLSVLKKGEKYGYPTIGDRVFLGNNAKIIGDVHVGNDAFVGVNSVLLKDIDDGAVAVGMPAVVKSHKGSGDYVGSYLDINNL